MHEPTKPIDERRFECLAYGVSDAARAINLSRSTIYELLATGQLASIKIGGRRLITRDALIQLINRGAG